MLNEGLGKLHFWLSAIPFNFIFIPLFFTGMAGQHRRIWDYTLFKDVNTAGLLKLNQLATLALLVMAAAQVIFIINVLGGCWPRKLSSSAA